VTSDCDADADVFNTHSYLNHSRSQVVADILHAGTDVDCGTFITGAAKKEKETSSPRFLNFPDVCPEPVLANHHRSAS
jgi:hypothetical protein